MKVNNIRSNELPEIDSSIKECVNLGQWLLFRSKAIQPDVKEAAYFLKAGTKIFCLNKNGKILETIEKEKLNMPIDELIYFSDLLQPKSLSNMIAR